MQNLPMRSNTGRHVAQSLLTSLCVTCTVTTSHPGANGSLTGWFCLVVLPLWEDVSSRCPWPSLRMLDVILSPWSLHYLLSSTMLPSCCAATWSARLASPRINQSEVVCYNAADWSSPLLRPAAGAGARNRSQKQIPPIRRLLLSQRENTHNSRRLPLTACVPCIDVCSTRLGSTFKTYKFVFFFLIYSINKQVQVPIIKWMMAEFHLAASVSGFWCGACWLPLTAIVHIAVLYLWKWQRHRRAEPNIPSIIVHTDEQDALRVTAFYIQLILCKW